MAVSVLCLFITVPWAGLQCVIFVFSVHAYFLIGAGEGDDISKTLSVKSQKHTF